MVPHLRTVDESEGCHGVSRGVTGCHRVSLCRKVAPDADQDIHGEMIAAGADADTAEWRTAEVELHSMQYITASQRKYDAIAYIWVPQAFIREVSLCLSRLFAFLDAKFIYRDLRKKCEPEMRCRAKPDAPQA